MSGGGDDRLRRHLTPIPGRTDRYVIVDRGPGGDRVARRGAWPEPEAGDDEEDEGGDVAENDDRAASTLTRLMLRHPADLPARAQEAKGALDAIAEHRLWLIPLLSALFVVTIEVFAGLSGRPLPMEAHAVLGAFWIFAVGRTGSREITSRRRGERIMGIAKRQGISARVAHDELELLEALIEQRSLERGGRDSDGR